MQLKQAIVWPRHKPSLNFSPFSVYVTPWKCPPPSPMKGNNTTTNDFAFVANIYCWKGTDGFWTNVRGAKLPETVRWGVEMRRRVLSLSRSRLSAPDDFNTAAFVWRGGWVEQGQAGEKSAWRAGKRTKHIFSNKKICWQNCELAGGAWRKHCKNTSFLSDSLWKHALVSAVFMRHDSFDSMFPWRCLCQYCNQSNRRFHRKVWAKCE